MSYLENVQKGINYIEANLEYGINLAQVAKESGLSQWHFQRIFKALTNETLKTYIRSRRLSNSLSKLLYSDQKIIDIALAAGYESQESYTRAFKKAFRLTPGEYRQLGDKSLFMEKIEFNHDYLTHINRNVSLVPDIYTQENMQLVGLRTRFYSVDSEKNNIAQTLPVLWEAFLARLNEISHCVPGICYGIVNQISDDTDQLEYYAAIEVSRIDSLPEGMVSFDLASSQYARFTHKGPIQDMNNTVNYIYSSWLLDSSRRHTLGPDIEIYGDQYHPSSEDSIIHYAIPVV